MSFNKNNSSKQSLKSLSRRSSFSDLKKKLSLFKAHDASPLSFDQAQDPFYSLMASHSIQHLPDKSMLEVQEEEQIKKLQLNSQMQM